MARKPPVKKELRLRFVRKKIQLLTFVYLMVLLTFKDDIFLTRAETDNVRLMTVITAPQLEVDRVFDFKLQEYFSE